MSKAVSFWLSSIWRRAGTSARIDEMIGLVEQGILKAVSVGFLPLKSEPIDKDRPHGGQRFLKQQLLGGIARERAGEPNSIGRSPNNSTSLPKFSLWPLASKPKQGRRG